jgi:hypothetical protein
MKVGDFLYICIMEDTVKDTCLYIHTRKSDGIIFYVGIGSKDRPYNVKQRSRVWKYTVKKHGHDVHVLAEGLSWEHACELEKNYISFYGRKDKKQGQLVNLTDGGDGANGCIRSEETKQKMRDVWTNDLREKKRLENIGEGNPMYGRSLYETMIDKYGEETATKKWGQMVEEKREQMLINNPHKNPEVKIKISKSLKGKPKSKQHKENLSKSRIGIGLGVKRPEHSKIMKGEGNPKSKLTEDNVTYIRTHYKPYSKDFGMKHLAKMFGVSVATIDLITRNKIWVDII